MTDETLARENARLREEVRRLEREHATLLAFVDATPVGLALIRRDHRFVHVNEMAARIDGLPRERYVGSTVTELLPRIAERVVPIYEAVFQTGEPRLGIEIDATLPETGDETRHFVGDFYPVQVDGDRCALGVCVREVTERRRLTLALQESEGRLRRLFDASPVFIVATEGRVQHRSQA